MMASLGNFKTLKISDARKNRRRTISEIDNFKNGPVSAVSIYSSIFSVTLFFFFTVSMLLTNKNKICLLNRSEMQQCSRKTVFSKKQSINSVDLFIVNPFPDDKKLTLS